MKKRHQINASHCREQINTVVEEYLDWKDVYADRIPDDCVGIVVFAANEKNQVFVEWRFDKKTVKIGSKTIFDDDSKEGLTAEVVWKDRT